MSRKSFQEEQYYDYTTVEGSRGHEWKLTDDGEVDIFALDNGFHNGPECVKCGYGFCHHCRCMSGPEDDCPGEIL